MKTSRLLPVEVRYHATAQAGLWDGSILRSQGAVEVWIGETCVASFHARQTLDEPIQMEMTDGPHPGRVLEVPNEPNTELTLHVEPSVVE